jgi:hypothetical protein
MTPEPASGRPVPVRVAYMVDVAAIESDTLAPLRDYQAGAGGTARCNADGRWPGAS